MTFPSEEWFARLAAAPASDPERYRRLGFANLRLVVEIVGDDATRRFGIVLDGYDVTSAGELTDVAAFRADATVTGPAAVWQEMVDNIDANGGADQAHTLNALTIAEAPLRVEAPDPIGRDLFFRYAETLQELFDATARQQAPA